MKKYLRVSLLVFCCGAFLAPAGLRAAPFSSLRTIGDVGVDHKVLVNEFVITGTQPKRILLRAIGPSFGGSFLADPTLELRGSDGALFETNDNWKSSHRRSDIEQSGYAPTDDREAAIFAVLGPGSYIAIMRGAGGSVGSGFNEFYDLDSQSASSIPAIGTRGETRGGNTPLLHSEIQLSEQRSVVVRALGPSLGEGDKAITGVVVDPFITLRDQNGTLRAANHDWEDGGNVAGTGLEPSHETEAAALAVDLPPGTYTAIAQSTGVDGIIFLQYYALPYNTPLDPAPITGQGPGPEPPTTCVTPPAGLTAWFTGDGDTTDLLEGNSGQIHDNANAEAPGKVGTGFGMDGDGDYVEVFNEAAIRPSHLTVDAWVKFDSLDSTRRNAPAGHQYIITKHNSRQNGSGFEEAYALVKVRQGGKDVFNFVLTTANTTRTGIVSTTAIQPGQFYHVAGTFDGQTARLYVNGILEASAPANFTLDYSSRSLYLGSSGIAGFDAYFNGVLDEVQIYNRALSATEIAALSNAGSFGVCKVRPGLWEAGRDLVINEKPDNPGETNAHNSVVPEWSYGYRSFAAGNAFTLFTPAQRFNNASLPDVQGFGVAGVPLVAVNVSAQPIVQNGVRPIYPGQMLLHPSTSNAFAVVRWTAPAAGYYRVLAEWLDLDPNGGNGASAHVVLDGTEVFGRKVGPDSAGPERFVGLEWEDGGGAELTAVDFYLNAGAVLDFAVGPRGDASFDTTTFNAVIRRVPGVIITNAPPDSRTEKGIELPQGSDITLEVEVDSVQPIQSVTLLVNGTDGPTDTTPPFSLTQTNLAPGVYYFSVKATDIQGVESASEPVKVISVKNSSATAAQGAKGASPQGAAVTGFLYTCQQSGPWQDPATWGTDDVPGRNDDAIIPPGFSVIDNAGVQIDNLSVGGSLIIGSPGLPKTLRVYGTLEVHGEIQGGNPLSLLVGFSRSNFVAGPATLSNLRVALDGQIIVTGDGGIGGSNTVLTIGGDMTLLSRPGTNRPTIVAVEQIELKGRLAPDIFGRILAPGGVIARDGASVIGMNGASAISENGAGVIGGNGASVIGMNGANVVGPNGASLVSERGGGLISNKGGGVHNPRPPGTPFGMNGPATSQAGEPGVTLERATLSGRINVIGNLLNQGGFVSPGNSAGKITVSGDYTQGAAGTLLLELGGTQTNQFDQLEIGGTANLGGNLVVKTIDGYTPAQGDAVSPLVYASQNGNFANVSSNAQISFGPNGAEVNVTGPNPPAPKALNIATRMKVETGDNALIAGFIITGSQPKKVIIRGIGPSLPFPGVLADPTLSLDNGAVTNDNWRSTQEQEIIDTTIPPSNNLESAIVATLNPGPHTAILRGSGNSTGIGVVEVYDLDSGSPVQLANISSRGFVQSGDDVMIGGFIIGGTYPANVIVRAIGPSLPFSGKLEDPTLELVNSNGGRISNDNWRETQETEIFLTTIPPTNDKEAAIVATLAPGNYTAIVRGKDNTTGIAVVEAYNLQ